MDRLELLSKLQNKPEPITIEGYGTYHVKGLSTSDFLYASAFMAEGQENQQMYFAAIVARCTLTEGNERVFKDEDVEALAEAEASFMLPLVIRIQQLSGNLSTDEDVKKD